MSTKSNKARNAVWFAVIALIVLHQDFWFWDVAKPYVFGFMPVGLAYHVLISLLASAVWFFATLYCFPTSEEETTSGNAAPAEIPAAATSTQPAEPKP
jgi:hypothetical protein